MSEYDPSIIKESAELGVDTFPPPVEEFLERISLDSSRLHDKIESEFTLSGLSSVERRQLKDIAAMVNQDQKIPSGGQNNPDTTVNPDERVAKQLVGTICTCLYEREQAGLPPLSELSQEGRKIQFNVDTLSNGNVLYILYPGDKAFWDNRFNHPFDIQVHLEEYEGTGAKKEMPGHNDFFSDLWWKMKQAHVERQSAELAGYWRTASAELFCGRPPSELLHAYPDLSDYTVGRTPEALLSSVYWIFIQEDFNYPRIDYNGRAQTYSPARKIVDSRPSDFGTNTGYYGGSQDPDNYSRYHDIMGQIKGHKGKLFPNSELQTDCYSL